MRVPRHYPGPEQTKAILAWAIINGQETKSGWINHFAKQSDEYQRDHYWQLRSILIYMSGQHGDYIVEAEL